MKQLAFICILLDWYFQVFCALSFWLRPFEVVLSNKAKEEKSRDEMRKEKKSCLFSSYSFGCRVVGRSLLPWPSCSHITSAGFLSNKSRFSSFSLLLLFLFKRAWETAEEKRDGNARWNNIPWSSAHVYRYIATQTHLHSILYLYIKIYTVYIYTHLTYQCGITEYHKLEKGRTTHDGSIWLPDDHHPTNL